MVGVVMIYVRILYPSFKLISDFFHGVVSQAGGGGGNRLAK